MVVSCGELRISATTEAVPEGSQEDNVQGREGTDKQDETQEHEECKSKNEAEGLIKDVVFPFPSLIYDLSPAELIAKGRAPVKKVFLRAPLGRVLLEADPSAPSTAADLVVANNPVSTGLEQNEAKSSKVSAVKKSKRQQKRDRQQAKKTAESICHAVAKTNDVNACPYGTECRFNHDLDAFLAQKSPDLPGECPFMAINRPCIYGAACRFAGSHVGQKNNNSEILEDDNPNELNALKKGFQKMLWKNLVSFPRAETQLQLLGILGKSKQRASEKSSSTVQSHDTPSPLNIDKNAKAGDLQIVHSAVLDQSVCDPSSEEDLRALKKPRIYSEQDILSSDVGKGFNDSSMITDDKPPSKGTQEADGFIECKLGMREKKLIDFQGKVYVAPLTTVGNLPFRRVCKLLGADVTCGEMAMCTNLLQGQASEWALMRRHRSEDVFGVQICAAYPDTAARAAEMIDKESEVDFIDLNVGCPIDLVVNKGAGSCLLTKPSRLQQIVKAASASIECQLTVKVRTGYFEGKNCVQSFIGDVHNWGASALTIHGRTRQQRYSKLADWDYIYKSCNLASDSLQVIGNGDIFSYTDWNEHLSASKLSSCMVARGVLIKPWLLTEIKEQRHWDITSNQRLDILKDYVRFGLEHWGSDGKGVETTRHFLLEWLSYMHRYIPVGLLEVIPQKLNWRPPLYYGRDELESMMASDSAADWVRISEMLLGPAPSNFSFTPRHKSNAYDRAENG